MSESTYDYARRNLTGHGSHADGIPELEEVRPGIWGCPCCDYVTRRNGTMPCPSCLSYEEARAEERELSDLNAQADTMPTADFPRPMGVRRPC